jgi:hypothetical protein
MAAVGEKPSTAMLEPTRLAEPILKNCRRFMCIYLLFSSWNGDGYPGG